MREGKTKMYFWNNDLKVQIIKNDLYRLKIPKICKNKVFTNKKLNISLLICSKQGYTLFPVIFKTVQTLTKIRQHQ